MKRKNSNATSVVLVEIAAKTALAIAKFVAAGITRSAAMTAEATHSSVDTVNALLLLFGRYRSRKPPDAEHQFGHGKELYFWSLIVAVSIFSVGGGISGLEAVHSLIVGSPLGNPTASYWVLGIAAVMELVSGIFAFKSFIQQRKSADSLWDTVRRTKDPRLFGSLFENGADLAGVLAAGLGIFLAHHLKMPLLDGLAGLVVAAIQACMAVCLAYESKELLLGMSAEPEELMEIKHLVEADADVEKADQPMTMHLGPDEMLLNLGIKFRAALSAAELVKATERLERRIRGQHPTVRRIFLDVGALRTDDTAGK